jgi:predicted glycoside hydrolase/deacetylase ChbG (UPF0249 family)
MWRGRTSQNGGSVSAVRLIVTADDYGYARGFNRGILEVAEAGAIDAVGAMVEREWCEPDPLLETGVEVGRHLELPGDGSEALLAQVERFEQLFHRSPAYLDGHKHSHACPPEVAAAVARLAAGRRIPVRSVNERHRRLLRDAGVRTPDRLVGRLDPSRPALPPLLAEGRALPAGVTEWMVHPGRVDPSSGSAYNEAREEDLELVLSLRDALGPLRGTHAVAL